MSTHEIQEVDSARVNQIIRNHTVLAGATGFIPTPALDLAALSAVQLKMIHELGKIHGLKFTEHAGKSVGSVALNTLIAPSLGGMFASALKIIPGIGTIAGRYAFHGYAAASTYAIGKLFHNHFASGGNLFTFDAAKVKDAYSAHVSKFKNKEADIKPA